MAGGRPPRARGRAATGRRARCRRGCGGRGGGARRSGPCTPMPGPGTRARFSDVLTGKILQQSAVTRALVSMTGTATGAQNALVRADLLVGPQRLEATSFQLELLPSGAVCRGKVQTVRSFGFDAVCTLADGTRRHVHAAWRLVDHANLRGRLLRRPGRGRLGSRPSDPLTGRRRARDLRDHGRPGPQDDVPGALPAGEARAALVSGGRRRDGRPLRRRPAPPRPRGDRGPGHGDRRGRVRGLRRAAALRPRRLRRGGHVRARRRGDRGRGHARSSISRSRRRSSARSSRGSRTPA